MQAGKERHSLRPCNGGVASASGQTCIRGVQGGKPLFQQYIAQPTVAESATQAELLSSWRKLAF